MAKYNISFNGSWDYSSVTWINDNVTFYNAAGDVVTDTAEATQWEVLDGVTIIGSDDGFYQSSFANCDSLVSIIIPDGTTMINTSAFSDCTALSSVTLPNSLSSIQSYAFSGCTALSSVTLPNSLSSIQSYVFSGCTALTTVDMPDSVVTAGGYLFSDCTALVDIKLSNSLEQLSYYMFNNCTALTEFTVPNTITYTQNNVFDSCTSLTTLILPDSVTTMDGAFCNNCPALDKIYVDPASSLEAMELVVERDNHDLVPLLVGIPDPVSTDFPSTFLLDEDGNKFISVAHADTVYLNELTDEGKSKTLTSKLAELGTVSDTKVDKVEGKQLSTNDFSNDDKAKLDSIASDAEVNVQSNWNETDNTSDAFILNKPVIPSIEGLATVEYVDAELTGKQDTLVNEVSIKSINGESILGEGNIDTPTIEVLQVEGSSVTAVMSQKTVTDLLATKLSSVSTGKIVNKIII